MSIFKRKGRWLDHQCRTPGVQGWSGLRAPGDRWQCKCGRVWEIGAGGRKGRYWFIIADPNRPEAK